MRVVDIALVVSASSAKAAPSSIPFRKAAALKTRDDPSRGIPISPIGVGTISWGDASRGFGTTFREKDATDAFQSARRSGINFFDTAEV